MRRTWSTMRGLRFPLQDRHGTTPVFRRRELVPLMPIPECRDVCVQRCHVVCCAGKAWATIARSHVSISVRSAGLLMDIIDSRESASLHTAVMLYDLLTILCLPDNACSALFDLLKSCPRVRLPSSNAACCSCCLPAQKLCFFLLHVLAECSVQCAVPPCCEAE